jgi:hypothetical protein
VSRVQLPSSTPKISLSRNSRNSRFVIRGKGRNHCTWGEIFASNLEFRPNSPLPSHPCQWHQNSRFDLAMTFTFEKLDVYQKALKWIEVVDRLCLQSRGQVSFNTLDQLSRASLSIALNIAEGNGRWHTADKRQFFWTARGFAAESSRY